MPTYQIWEDDIIREHYGKVSLKEMETLLPNRSWRSISERARKIGLVVIHKKTCPICLKEFESKMGARSESCSQSCARKKHYRKNKEHHSANTRFHEKERRTKIPKTFESWSIEEIRELWNSYRKSKYLLKDFAARKGYGENLLRLLFKNSFPDEWDDEVEKRKGRWNSYRSGRAFEYRVKDILAHFGYWVLRSPQSKSPTDLVALKRGASLLVQCKTRRIDMKESDWNSILELANSVGSLALLAYRNPKSTNWEVIFETYDGKQFHPDSEMIKPKLGG